MGAEADMQELGRSGPEGSNEARMQPRVNCYKFTQALLIGRVNGE